MKKREVPPKADKKATKGKEAPAIPKFKILPPEGARASEEKSEKPKTGTTKPPTVPKFQILPPESLKKEEIKMGKSAPKFRILPPEGAPANKKEKSEEKKVEAPRAAQPRRATKPERHPGPKAKAEKKEKPEISIEKSRADYVQAKLELEKSPRSSAAKKNFEDAQKKYFSERQQELQSTLEILEKEWKNKPEKAKDLQKATTTYILDEVKKVYDVKTEKLVSERAKEKPWIFGKVNQLHDWYKGLSTGKKIMIGAGLGIGGAVFGAMGGSVGSVLGGVFIGVRGALSGASAFTFTESVIKKVQEKGRVEKESKEYQKYQSLVEESLKESKTNSAKGLIKFLQSRDVVLALKKGADRSDEKLREYEGRLQSRRYLWSAVAGVVVGLGVSHHAVEKLADSIGLTQENLARPAAERILPAAPDAAPESIVRIAEQHANFTETIEKGGSISKSAWQLVYEGKLSKEEMLKAWNHSFVEIHGVQVPIKDISLSHAGDQVTYVPGTGGTAGHFEVADFTKDKLSLGTNQDLYQIYEKLGKETPNWLKHATDQNVFEAMKDNHLDVNEIRNIHFSFDHGTLNDKDVILNELNSKISNLSHTNEALAKPFVELRDNLSDSSGYNSAVRAYENIFEPTRLTGTEYDHIRDMKVGDFLAKRGRSWMKEYFFNREGISFSEMSHQRKLAELIRKALLSAWEKNLTVEQFMKMQARG